MTKMLFTVPTDPNIESDDEAFKEWLHYSSQFSCKKCKTTIRQKYKCTDKGLVD